MVILVSDVLIELSQSTPQTLNSVMVLDVVWAEAMGFGFLGKGEERGGEGSVSVTLQVIIEVCQTLQLLQ